MQDISTAWYTEENAEGILNEGKLSFENERKKADKTILALRDRIRNNLYNIKRFAEKLGKMEDTEEHTTVRKRYSDAIETLKKDNIVLKKTILRVQTNLSKLKRVSHKDLRNAQNSGSEDSNEEVDETVEPFLEIEPEEEENSYKILEKESPKIEESLRLAIQRGKALNETKTQVLKNYNDLTLVKKEAIKKYQDEIKALKEKLGAEGASYTSEKKMQINKKINSLIKAIAVAKEDLEDLIERKGSFIKNKRMEHRS
jgi:hypothetical protein